MKQTNEIFVRVLPRWLVPAILVVCACAAFLGSLLGQSLEQSKASAQVYGNGGPGLCDGLNITCTNGVMALNTGGTLGASLPLCTNASALITTTACASGDTITTPNGSLTVGGTSTNTTLDINPAHTVGWTVNQTNTGQYQAIGAGGANACSGANYPANAFGFCVGANNGTGKIGLVISPAATDFACTTSCTAGDSASINFYDSLTTGATSACGEWYARTVGSVEFNCSVYVSLQMQAKANGFSAPTYLAPVYTQSGGGGTSGERFVKYSCTFAAATTCVASFSGTGNSFTSATSYQCFPPDMGTATSYVGYTVGNKTTTGVTIYASASNSNTVYGLCEGD